eukprot:m.29395 g.29395  ORF g.29395 m.29395 type:complete len:61 (+) comp10524_c0_seq1:128-310(+)
MNVWLRSSSFVFPFFFPLCVCAFFLSCFVFLSCFLFYDLKTGVYLYGTFFTFAGTSKATI